MMETFFITDLGKDKGVWLQNKQGFCFGEDSVFLAHFAADHLKKKGPYYKEIADICAGSGIIGYLCMCSLERPLHLHWIEKEQEMCTLTIENYFLNHKSFEQRQVEVSFWQGDITSDKQDWISLAYDLKKDACETEKVYRKNFLEKSYPASETPYTFLTNVVPSKDGQTFQKQMKEAFLDAILMNPPYYRSQQGPRGEKGNTSREQARKEEKGLASFLRCILPFLKERGEIFLVYPCSRLNEVFSLGETLGLRVVGLRFIHVEEHIASKRAMFILQRGKLATETRIFPPLIVRQTTGKYTEEVQRYFM